VRNPRDFATDARRTVDDRPYGGGPGMVMMAEPLAAAINAARAEQATDVRVIYLSPQGRRLDQAAVTALAARSGLILLAGRYEGVDERLLAAEVDEEWSIGDYVLSGGELPAMVLIDAVARLLPGSPGTRGLGATGFICTWPAGLRSLHAARGVCGRHGAGGAVVRQPRAHTALAVAAGAGTDLAETPGPVGEDAVEQRAARPAGRVPAGIQRAKLT
jgi:hypothetical protein